MSRQRTPRVLIVDDEPSIGDAVASALRLHSIEPTVVLSGLDALRAIRREAFNVIVLDVMLPDYTGFDIAQIIRDEGVITPVLFLTARDRIDDKVTGLGIGDDYLTKPFQVAELVARVGVLLRRSNLTIEQPIIRVADLAIDLQSHRASRAGQTLQLTATEFRLLHHFMVNADRVQSKQQILDAVWGYEFAGDVGVVETYVRYLRRKLELHGRGVIDTVRLVGYVLRSQDRAVNE